MAVGQVLPSLSASKIRELYEEIKAQLSPLSPELKSLLDVSPCWGSLYRFACTASTPLDILLLQIICKALKDKRLQREMKKYDTELSALHLGVCASEGVAVVLEESGYEYFIAEVDSPASLPLSAIPNLQSFLRENLQLYSYFAGYHREDSGKVLLYLKTSTQKHFPSPKDFHSHCPFLQKLGMCKVGLLSGLLLKTDDLSVTVSSYTVLLGWLSRPDICNRLSVSSGVWNEEDWNKAYSDDLRLRMVGTFLYQEENAITISEQTARGDKQTRTNRVQRFSVTCVPDR